MRIAIIASRKDTAGMNIARQLEAMQDFPAQLGGHDVTLELIDEWQTEADNIDRKIAADIFIFASRHVSKAGVHSLSLHSIGNWGAAIGGGKESYLVPAPSALMKLSLQLLAENAQKARLDYEIVQEATHHGPFMEKPAMFIEIGSDEQRWADEAAGKVVANTILESIKKLENGTKAYIGIGGLHYCSNFQKVVMDGTALSYVCPKHRLEGLDEGMMRQAIEKSIPEASGVILDWKGLGKEKARVLELLGRIGVEARRTSDFQNKK